MTMQQQAPLACLYPLFVAENLRSASQLDDSSERIKRIDALTDELARAGYARPRSADAGVIE